MHPPLVQAVGTSAEQYVRSSLRTARIQRSDQTRLGLGGKSAGRKRRGAIQFSEGSIGNNAVCPLFVELCIYKRAFHFLQRLL